MPNQQQQLEQLGQSYDLPVDWLIQRPHLFSEATVTLSANHVEQITHTVQAIERVVSLPAYQQQALAQAPITAQHNAGNAGVLFGYDFHLTNNGVKLIEMNTNAGGAFLTALLHQASTNEFTHWRQALLEMFLCEWRSVRGTLPLRRVAIVDENPTKQFLYPEFLILQHWLQQRDIDCVIVDPQQLQLKQQLCVNDLPIDLVYNRLTDFMLTEPQHAVLASAYLNNTIMVTPHPRAHALYANKTNLVLLSNDELLQQWHVSGDDRAQLQQVIPHTFLVTRPQASALWDGRKTLFFKPRAGHASKGVYRGAKLTRGVFETILHNDYIAQDLIPASEMHFGELLLKIDVRAYVYQAKVLGFVARLYQGQVTNMQTTGGGFARVEVEQ